MKLNYFKSFKALVIILINLSLDLTAQNNILNGKTFQSIDEPSIYKYYGEKFVFTFWVYKENVNETVDVNTLLYGFCNSCDLPSIKELKQSGVYYFEVDSSDFADEETAHINIHNACGELNLFSDGGDTHMNIYYNSRQQYATYKQIKALPKNIRVYFEKKGIRFPK